MTTKRQVARLVKPLLERQGDLLLRGKWLYLAPVRHVIRAILIDRTGEAARFRPHWVLDYLFEPRERPILNWGQRIFRGGLWRWDDPQIAERLVAAVEEVALPIIRPVDTIEKFRAHAEGTGLTAFSGYLLRKVGMDIALGDLAGARETCALLATGKTIWSSPLMAEEFAQVMQGLCAPLAAGDVASAVAKLHEWEAYSADRMGLRGIWEPTPFPIEVSGPVS